MGGFNLIIKVDEVEPEAAEILASGSIGGQPYLFLLDTGAGRSSVLLDDYTARLEMVGRHDSGGVFARGSRDLVMLPSLELGPIAIRNLTVTRIHAETPGLRSLIGMDVLKDHSYHFLFDENRVVVDPTGPAEFAFQPLFLGQKFHPYLEVQFGGETVSAVWDTGAGITVVDLGLIERQPDFFREAGRSSGTDSTGASTETPMYYMSGAVIGSQQFPPSHVAGVDLSQLSSPADPPVDLILGYNILRYANWWMDFPGKRWTITKMFKTD